MPYGDGIAKINSYSLTDFHDFDFCPFRFFVKHHLDKKYEIEEGNRPMALGSLLDQTIKLFHKSKAYSQPSDYLGYLVQAAAKLIKERVAKQPGPSFYASIVEFLDDKLIQKATEVFRDFYQKRGRKINQSLGEVGFCEWIIAPVPSGTGQVYKLWGGPDALELGDDGMPEVVDYKSRDDVEAGINGLDMDLMPKVYTLLVTSKLTKLGYDKARFRVRIWQDPLNEDLYEEFDLGMMEETVFLIKQKIDRIVNIQEIKFCEKNFCRACNSDKRQQYLQELAKLGLYD